MTSTKSSLQAQHHLWEASMPHAIKESINVSGVAAMGSVVVEKFDSSWLSSYPMVLDHVLSEHALHVKGLDDDLEGLTWHKEKFNATQHNPQLSPECHFQMKVGYFLIPQDQLVQKTSLLPPASHVREQIYERIGGQNYVKFFVHPDAYEHYAPLLVDATVIQDPVKARALESKDFNGKSMVFVSSQASSVLGTPTSSYRSWVVCDTAGESAAPFIAKVGVPCQVLGSDRWLSEAEIERSVGCQMAFDSMRASLPSSKEGCRFEVFSESLGIAIAHPSYRDAYTKHSGLLIREFPTDVLEGKVRIASCAALMSVESARSGGRPWICDMIDASISRGECASAKEFVAKHFVDNYLEAIEPVVLAEGLTIEPHSQNLCIILSPGSDSRILGFAYRDHGGIWVDLASRVMHGQRVDFFACNMMMDRGLSTERSPQSSKSLVKAQGAIDRAYIQSFAWFYRYQVLIKLFNSTLDAGEGERWMPSGAPYQIGLKEPIPERILSSYVVKHLAKEDKTFENFHFGKRLRVDVSVIESDVASKLDYKENNVHSQNKVQFVQNNPSQVKESSVASVALRVDEIARKVLPNTLQVTEAEEVLKHLDMSYIRCLDRYFIAESLADRLPMPAAEGGAGIEVEQSVSAHHRFFGHWRMDAVDWRTLSPWSAIDLGEVDQAEAITHNGKPLDEIQISHFNRRPSGVVCYYVENGDVSLVAVIPKIK